MRRVCKFVLGATMVFGCFAVEASVLPLQKDIEKLLKPYGKNVSFYFQTVGGGKAAYEAKTSMSPASIAKLISSACALHELGPEYEFETSFGYTGLIDKDILKGNLVIKGSGDPSFVIEDLKEILEKIQVLYGIQKIQGSLVFDVSYFARSEIDVSGDFEGDEGRSFQAALTPLALNHNSFSTWILPEKGTSSSKSQIQILPKEVFLPKIKNQVKVVPTGSAQLSVNFDPNNSQIVVDGKIPEGMEPKAYYRALPNPYESYARLVHRIWNELGGEWEAPKYSIEPKSISAQSLIKHRSRSVSRILLDVNKLSTNFAAELVTMAAAARKWGAPVTSEKVKKFLSDCLSSFSTSPDKIFMENASGLSRTSFMNTEALVQFLNRVLEKPYAPEYLSSLSVLGRDGTTRSRLREHAGKARLKTGSIRGVRSIAGYILPTSLDRGAFALIFNCASCSGEQMKRTEDQILELLIQHFEKKSSKPIGP